MPISPHNRYNLRKIFSCRIRTNRFICIPKIVFNLDKISHYLYDGNSNPNIAEFHGFFWPFLCKIVIFYRLTTGLNMNPKDKIISYDQMVIA